MRRAAAISAGCLLLLTGCGGGETVTPTAEEVQGTVPTQTQAQAEGDAAAGKEIFASAGCGSCHIFEPAGSSGEVGPNLDEAEMSYEEAVTQIRNGGNGMPAFKDELSEKQIADVATFVVQPAAD